MRVRVLTIVLGGAFAVLVVCSGAAAATRSGTTPGPAMASIFGAVGSVVTGQTLAPPATGVSALTTAPTVRDAERKLAFAAEVVPNLKLARVVGTFHGIEWYLAPGHNGDICFIELRPSGVWTETCVAGQPYRGEGPYPLYLTSAGKGGSQLEGIVVPDGYTKLNVLRGAVRDLPRISHNVAFVEHRGTIQYEVSGPGLPTRRYTSPDFYSQDRR